MKKLFIVFILSASFGSALTNSYFDNSYQVYSPDKRIKIFIDVTERISYSVYLNGNRIIEPSDIALILADGDTLGVKGHVKDIKRFEVKDVIKPVVPVKSEVISNEYNEIVLYFDEDYAVRFRVCNDGIAYKFETSFTDTVEIVNELAEYNFSEDPFLYFPEENSFVSHYEREYKYLKTSVIEKGRFCSLPVLALFKEGARVVVSESDLYDYPGMFLEGTGGTGLNGLFPEAVLEAEPHESGPDRAETITQRAEYIARTSGTRSFPWRLMIIADNDADILKSELVYKLASPLKIKSTDWIKPGKVAWDWWNALNIFNVDFKAGINTQTYKYYIDFASEFGIEYVILDEGWSETTELLNVVPEIDIKELTSYAAKKNVGLILWVLWKPLYDNIDAVLDQFKEWGVKGIKVDFMQRNDQWMVNYYKLVAEEAAERELIVDFHGSYKPSGLRRAYPNVLTREGVRGLEWCKWSDYITPEHNLILPFTRMTAGPMDYTPGAMQNAHKDNYSDFFSRPMSMSTRTHQLAMYVIYESPLQMMSDNPQHYYEEPECMEFLSAVPTVWHETVVLKAAVSDYIVMARRHNDDWYIGGMTDSKPREFEITLNFLDDTGYDITIYRDGINADNYAEDFELERTTVKKDDTVKIKMAADGGFAARLVKAE